MQRMESPNSCQTKPDLPGLNFRGFRGAVDFPLMAQVANASFAADGMDAFRASEDIARDYASFTSCNPYTDMVMVEIDSALIGYARSWYWTQDDGVMLFGQVAFLLAQWRRHGIGGAMLAWLEQRQRSLALERPGAAGYAHYSFVTQGETARAVLLQKAGYRPARHFFKMVRPNLEEIEELALPLGLELRPVRPEHYRAIYDAHMEALHSVWGFTPPAASDYDVWLNRKAFQPHLWQVAWDVESDEVAGQVKPFIDDVYNRAFVRRRGWTEFISVGEKWRRRGVARALISHALRAQRDAGMTESALGVDSTSAHGASRIYEDCGFRVVARNTAYRKEIHLVAV
jgi:mycothiol synthase